MFLNNNNLFPKYRNYNNSKVLIVKLSIKIHKNIKICNSNINNKYPI